MSSRYRGRQRNAVQGPQQPSIKNTLIHSAVAGVGLGAGSELAHQAVKGFMGDHKQSGNGVACYQQLANLRQCINSDDQCVRQAQDVLNCMGV